MKTVIKVCRINGENIRLEIQYGLNYIKGNRLPHFSITANGWKANASGERDARYSDCKFGGCVHDEILKVAPELAPIIALHLSDMDGVPMHAEANGLYWLAGIDGGRVNNVIEQYHGGQTATPERCLEIWRDHCRLSDMEARVLHHAIRGNDKTWKEACAAMRPRWKAEADAAIEQFELTVSGDIFEAATV